MTPPPDSPAAALPEPLPKMTTRLAAALKRFSDPSWMGTNVYDNVRTAYLAALSEPKVEPRAELPSDHPMVKMGEAMLDALKRTDANVETLHRALNAFIDAANGNFKTQADDNVNLNAALNNTNARIAAETADRQALRDAVNKNGGRATAFRKLLLDKIKEIQDVIDRKVDKDNSNFKHIAGHLDTLASADRARNLAIETLGVSMANLRADLVRLEPRPVPAASGPGFTAEQVRLLTAALFRWYDDDECPFEVYAAILAGRIQPDAPEGEGKP